MPRYRAISEGYDNVKVREVGEEFDFDGKPGPWMELVESERSAADEKKDEKPDASSKKKPQSIARSSGDAQVI